jgi:hypothetical protein
LIFVNKIERKYRKCFETGFVVIRGIKKDRVPNNNSAIHPNYTGSNKRPVMVDGGYDLSIP